MHHDFPRNGKMFFRGILFNRILFSTNCEYSSCIALSAAMTSRKLKGKRSRETRAYDFSRAIKFHA